MTRQTGRTETDFDFRRFARRLLRWHATDGRHDLPWQGEPGRLPDAYRVWVSEIMLQQTQVSTVIPYFQRFMQRFPDLAALAAAQEDDVLAYWSGLGYYTRGRNLLKAARQLQQQFAGRFPREPQLLQTLPGVGRSTAAAIAAQAYNEPAAIMDGNVKRVLARVHAVAGWPGRSAVSAQLWALAEQHTPKTAAARYTQAIMDLGATVCARRQPACQRCPAAPQCHACRHGRQADYPGRQPRRAKPMRTLPVVAPLDMTTGQLFLEQRPAVGIWAGLWSFPELPDGLAPAAFCRSHGWRCPKAAQQALTPFKHSLTHVDFDVRPILLRVTCQTADVTPSRESRPGEWLDPNALGRRGVSVLVRKILDQLRALAVLA